MSELEYHGTYTDHPKEVVNSTEAQEDINNAAQTEAQMEQEVTTALAGKATQSFVTTEAGKLATPENANTAFSNRITDSALGLLVAQLDNTGKLPTSYFPGITTRGAKFFTWSGTMNNQTSTTSNPSIELARMTVSNSNTLYYTIWAWAQVETKLDVADQTPGLEITTVQGGEAISQGFGKADYTDDWAMTSCVPYKSRYVFTGNTTLVLKTRRAGLLGSADIIYSGYKPTFSALVVPVSYGT